MTQTTVSQKTTLSDQQISDAYIYLLGRLLITRQQQVDFDTEGFVWNQLIHRKPGQVDWPNQISTWPTQRPGWRSTRRFRCNRACSRR